MLYFSSQPVAVDTVDLEQVRLLKEFKDSCQKQGLYEQYDSHTDFKNKFFHHLQLKLNEHDLFNSVGKVSISEIFESKTNLPSLTSEAKTLIKEASSDENGNILLLRHMGGTLIQVSGKVLIDSDERREVAKWEGAIQELLGNDLLVERGHKGEMFEITNLGYQIADMIQL